MDTPSVGKRQVEETYLVDLYTSQPELKGSGDYCGDTLTIQAKLLPILMKAKNTDKYKKSRLVG